MINNTSVSNARSEIEVFVLRVKHNANSDYWIQSKPYPIRNIRYEKLIAQKADFRWEISLVKPCSKCQNLRLYDLGNHQILVFFHLKGHNTLNAGHVLWLGNYFHLNLFRHKKRLINFNKEYYLDMLNLALVPLLSLQAWTKALYYAQWNTFCKWLSRLK